MNDKDTDDRKCRASEPLCSGTDGRGNRPAISSVMQGTGSLSLIHISQVVRLLLTHTAEWLVTEAEHSLEKTAQKLTVDVYKRQECLLQRRCQEHGKDFEGGVVMNTGDTAFAVSYTHLDVYKRQVENSVMSTRPAGQCCLI